MAFITESVHCAVGTGSSDIDNFSGNFTVLYRLLILAVLLYIRQQLLHETYCNNTLCVKTEAAAPRHHGSKICRGDGLYGTCRCWYLHNGNMNIICFVYMRLFNLNVSIYAFMCFCVCIMLTASVVQNCVRH